MSSKLKGAHHWERAQVAGLWWHVWAGFRGFSAVGFPTAAGHVRCLHPVPFPPTPVWIRHGAGVQVLPPLLPMSEVCGRLFVAR
jgi:hypothetical protein